LRRILRWVIGLPIIILVMGFAIANRKWVDVSFNPFTQSLPSLPMPLWFLLFIGIFMGLIIGWIGAWIAQGKHRKAAREARSEVSQLQRELTDLRKPGEPARMQDVVPFNGGIM
jgi:uncharacterized integral membrane protein